MICKITHYLHMLFTYLQIWMIISNFLSNYSLQSEHFCLCWTRSMQLASLSLTENSTIPCTNPFSTCLQDYILSVPLFFSRITFLVSSSLIFFLYFLIGYKVSLTVLHEQSFTRLLMPLSGINLHCPIWQPLDTWSYLHLHFN